MRSATSAPSFSVPAFFTPLSNLLPFYIGLYPAWLFLVCSGMKLVVVREA